MNKKIKEMRMFRSRIIIAFFIFILLVVGLSLRVAYIQIIKGEEYTKKAIENQKKDIVLKPTRGKILDTNGEELAVSVDSFTVWAKKKDMMGIRPTKTKEEKKEDKKKTKEELFEDNVKTLAEALEQDEGEIKETIENSNQSVIKVAKYLDREKADKIRELRIPGISTSDEPRRYYPMGDFLSHTLGSTRDDNEGLSGIELEYNHYLAGVEGRWLKDTDTRGKTLAFGDEKYYKPEDGDDVILTIDQVIQNYVEKSVKEVQKESKATRVSCIIMDVKTGAILSMASAPSFNPNNSKEPTDSEEKAKFDKLDNLEKVKYLNEMWRNPFFSNVYEPGSTMKLITTAACLEEGITHKEEKFTCTGSYNVTGVDVKCWSYKKPHGVENLYQGLGNSCNPVMLQLALRLGKEKFYAYQDLFGISEKTGIDFPGEAKPIIINKDAVKPLELATMGIGQTSAVTPIQLVSAVSAMGNDGKLMRPHLLKKVVDKDGNTVKENKPIVVRKAISKKTADEMREVMKFVVDEGLGKKAQVAGYSIGGKTGTAQVPGENGGYTNDTIASFVGMAPMEDPQFTILYIVERPQGITAGSMLAAPASGAILEEILKYKNIKPTRTDDVVEQKEETVTVPSLKGKNFSEAKSILDEKEIKYKVTPKIEEDKDFVIKEQYPEANTTMSKKSIVYLYRE